MVFYLRTTLCFRDNWLRKFVKYRKTVKKEHNESYIKWRHNWDNVIDFWIFFLRTFLRQNVVFSYNKVEKTQSQIIKSMKDLRRNFKIWNDVANEALMICRIFRNF